MASIKYIWSNRVRFPIFSISFFKAWAKRILTLNELIRRNRNRQYLVKRGANISDTAEIGRIICNGSARKLEIGDNTFIGSSVEFALHDKIFIGDNVCVNDGVKFLTASHKLDDPKWQHKKAVIKVGDYAWIATNVIILPGVHIGRGAVIGAGAVLSKNVGDYEIAVGNPATVIGKKRTSNLDYNPCEFLAANRAWLKK